jgi:glutamine synthetase
MKTLRESLTAAGVHTLLVHITDMHGIAKGKLVPLTHLDDVMTNGAAFSGAAIAGSGLPRTGPRAEFMARAAASTARPLPWLPGVAAIVADGFVAGEPFEACPRQVLKRAVARLAERKWTLKIGIEPEFFLLKAQAGTWLPADDADRLAKPSYDLKSVARQMPFLRDLHDTLERCGLDVQQLDHEDAQGQYEVNFAAAHALASADHLMLFKLAAQAIAARHDLVFSMMPKPFADQPGSGMHCHASLWQGPSDDARNVFMPHRQDGSIDSDAVLAPLGRQFVAGVLAHAGALTALASPTVNSYKRVSVGDSPAGARWIPAWAAHGPHNRSALIRTLRDRFEWRAPDASANPYLILAGLIAAGLDGIDRKLDPGPDIHDDLFELSPAQLAERGIAALPQDLGQAIDALEADATICGALGETLAREFVAAKRAEQSAYSRHVSDWELQRYVTAF